MNEDKKPRWIKIFSGYKCPFCGNEMMDEWNYCPECGEKLEQTDVRRIEK